MTPFLRPHLTRLLESKPRRIASGALALLILTGATLAVRAALQSPSPDVPQLAAILPQGALLTIEAKDFGGLLKQWSDSPENAAWLKSASYSVFSNSRLYGRLGDAQKEFAVSAGLPPDAAFLKEVAGDRSVFAWYDIGKLEFLYITHMPSGSADKTRLLRMRGKFARRQIGSQTFYVRTLPDPNGPAPGQPSPNLPGQTDQQPADGVSQGQVSQDQVSQDQVSQDQAPQDQGSGQPRTVAFAVSGDWLLLATREDLMAGALTLLDVAASKPATAKPATTNPVLPNPVSRESWFTDGLAAAAKEPGDLRMTLNLGKIVPTPYFESYWIQHNNTEMRQYRSAVADLYTDAAAFREERVLLPKSAPDHAGATSDLAAVAQLLPERAGVYRVQSAPSVDAAVAILNDKLLQRATGSYADTRTAPNADVSVQATGSASDLDTRIDTAPLAVPARGKEVDLLRQALKAAHLNAMMTVSRTGEPADGVWVPFRSAVVLASSQPWDLAAMQIALQQAAGAQVTTSSLGLAWKPVNDKAGGYLELSETRPLEMAARGKLLILSDDPGLMQEMLTRASAADPDRKKGRSAASGADLGIASETTLVAGFDLARERGAFARWSGLVDRTNDSPAGQNPSGRTAFFSQTMRSLGDTFSALQSERVVERRDGPLTRQTVTYAWQH